MEDRAQMIVLDYIQKHLDKSDNITEFGVYTVWKCKTLQNWKFLISSTLLDGMYYEVTFNGDKSEWYLDAYKKFENKVIREDTADTPQTESTGSPIGDYRDGVGAWQSEQKKMTEEEIDTMLAKVLVGQTDCEDRYAIRTDSGEVVAYACPLGCEQTDCPWKRGRGDMTFTLNLPQLIEVYLLGVATVTTILLAIQVFKK